MLSQRQQKAFTLIEVMAAVAIFAIAATGLYTINQQSIRVADRLENKTIAQWVALNAFNRLSLEEDLPGVGSRKSDEDMAGQNWKVESVISETPVMTVRRVTVRVSNESGQTYAQLDGFLGAKQVLGLNANQ